MTITRTLILLSLSLLVACSGPSYKADRTPQRDAGRALPAEKGVIIDVQRVTIEYDAEKAQAVGAVVGGVVANQATEDSNRAVRTVATVAGTAAGAAAGDMVAQNMLSPEGEELIIELENGAVVSVTQEPGSARLYRGDTVWVIRGAERTRVFRRDPNTAN